MQRVCIVIRYRITIHTCINYCIKSLYIWSWFERFVYQKRVGILLIGCIYILYITYMYVYTHTHIYIYIYMCIHISESSSAGMHLFSRVVSSERYSRLEREMRRTELLYRHTFRHHTTHGEMNAADLVRRESRSWVMPHAWMSRITRTNRGSRSWIMSHIWMSRITHVRI